MRNVFWLVVEAKHGQTKERRRYDFADQTSHDVFKAGCEKAEIEIVESGVTPTFTVDEAVNDLNFAFDRLAGRKRFEPVVIERLDPLDYKLGRRPWRQEPKKSQR